MKNKDLYILRNVIEQVKDKGNNKFKLALILNEKCISERIDSLEKLREQSPEFKEFEQKRRELISAHAELDENGQVVVYTLPDGKGERTNNGYGYPNIVRETEKYDKALADLQEEYKDATKAEVEKETEFEKTLDQDIEPSINFHQIEFAIIPEITFEEMKVLMPLIKED